MMPFVLQYPGLLPALAPALAPALRPGLVLAACMGGHVHRWHRQSWSPTRFGVSGRLIDAFALNYMLTSVVDAYVERCVEAYKAFGMLYEVVPRACVETTIRTTPKGTLHVKHNGFDVELALILDGVGER